jgi:hypothetical protein
MYTLSRIPVVETIGNIDRTYHFEVCNFINDKIVCRLSVTEKPKNTFRVRGDTIALYDFVVRDTNELNDLYNNPEAALEYMAKESFGHRFVYFEFLLGTDDHSFTYRQKNVSFLRFVQIRKNFSNISKDGILVQSCAKDSKMFDWNGTQYDRAVYKGYAFINEMWEPEEFWDYYKDEITKQIKNFEYHNFEIGE